VQPRDERLEPARALQALGHGADVDRLAKLTIR
jgi:hypothetical protein